MGFGAHWEGFGLPVVWGFSISGVGNLRLRDEGFLGCVSVMDLRFRFELGFEGFGFRCVGVPVRGLGDWVSVSWA